jgi:hypothetical protein
MVKHFLAGREKPKGVKPMPKTGLVTISKDEYWLLVCAAESMIEADPRCMGDCTVKNKCFICRVKEAVLRGWGTQVPGSIPKRLAVYERIVKRLNEKEASSHRRDR